MEAMKNGEVSAKSVSLPFTPMNRVICHNPKIVIGISGVRHIQRAGGLAVWPVFYLSKDQVGIFCRCKNVSYLIDFSVTFQYNDNNKSFNTKVMRVNFPLHKLDEVAEGLYEMARGLGFEICQK